MNTYLKHFAVFFALVSAISVTTQAHATDPVDGIEEIGAAVFSDIERRLIREYYHKHRDGNHAAQGGHSKGKKSKGKGAKGNKHVGGNSKGLPPGIVMKLKRGGVLPPGLAKRNLPNDLETGLPPRDRYRRYEVAAQVILVDIVTDVIVDIIDIVFD